MAEWVVEPNAVGGWDVHLPGTDDAARRCSSRADAEAAAAALAERDGGTVITLDPRGGELGRSTVLPTAEVAAARSTTAAAAAGARSRPVTKAAAAPAPARPAAAEPASRQRRARPDAAPGPAPAPPDARDALVVDLLDGYRTARADALQADGAVRGLIVRDLVLSAENALSRVRLHAGDGSPAAQRLSTFLDDLRREDWVKKTLSFTTAGLAVAGVDTATVVMTALGGFVLALLASMAIAADVASLALGAGGVALVVLLRGSVMGLEGLGTFFAMEMPAAGLVERRVADAERRLFAVTGGRSPLVRVTDATGHAMKVGVGALAAAVAVGLLVGAVAFFQGSTGATY